jgi:hypothetical protein
MVLKKHSKRFSLKNKGRTRRKITRLRRSQRHVTNRKKHTKRNKKINKGGRKKGSSWWKTPFTAATAAAASQPDRFNPATAAGMGAGFGGPLSDWMLNMRSAQEENPGHDTSWYDAVENANQPDYAQQVCPAEIIEGEVLDEPVRPTGVLSTINEEEIEDKKNYHQLLTGLAGTGIASAGYLAGRRGNGKAIVDAQRRGIAEGMNRNLDEMGDLLELPQCPICFERYSSERNKAYILGCGHTFCESCIKGEILRNINLGRCLPERAQYGDKFSGDIREEIDSQASLWNGVLSGGGPAPGWSTPEANPNATKKAAGYYIRFPCPKRCHGMSLLSLKNYNLSRIPGGDPLNFGDENEWEIIYRVEDLPLDELLIRNLTAETNV